MKKLLFLWFIGVGGLAWAQTGALLPKSAAQQTVITSDHGYVNGNTRQVVYYSHVLVTNANLTLTCEWLSIDLPSTGQPTNIVAETNVVVNYTDQKGQTNLLTAAKAVYAYSLLNGVTNETITFTGHPRYENAQVVETGDPFVWDNVAKLFIVTHGETHPRQVSGTGAGTNTMPFNFLK